MGRDPLSCDVIVAGSERFSGQKAAPSRRLDAVAQGGGLDTPDPARCRHTFPGKTRESCGRVVLGACPNKGTGVAKTCHWAEGVAVAQRGKTSPDERPL